MPERSLNITSVFLPSAPTIAQLFRTLLDRDVTVVPVGSVAAATVAPSPPPIVGVYATDQGVVAAVWAFDYALANAAGAALSLVPAKVAAQFAAARSVPDVIAENLAEIANVGTGALNAAGARHLKFQRLLLTTSDLPPSVAALVHSPRNRLDATVTIAGYGAGRLSIVVSA